MRYIEFGQICWRELNVLSFVYFLVYTIADRIFFLCFCQLIFWLHYMKPVCGAFNRVITNAPEGISAMQYIIAMV